MDELIILKYFDKTASQAEIVAVEEWLGQSNANQTEFDRLKKLWRASTQLKDYQAFDKKAAWAKIQAAIEEKQIDNGEREIRRIPLLKQDTSKSGRHFALRIAAILLVFFMIGFIFNYFNERPSNTIAYQTVESEDKILKIPLPDGSVVWLNQHSTLEYPSPFPSDLRTVRLKGEAFFEVAKDKKKPFVIEAGETNVKVLGTSFNVVNREKTPIEVTVESGKVQFYSKKDDAKKVILEKKEKGIFDSNQVLKADNKDVNFLSWKTGVLDFSDETLPKVLATLSRHFDTKIQLSNGSPLAECKLTDQFENQHIEEILKDLQLIFDFSYSSNNGQYLLKGGACETNSN